MDGLYLYRVLKAFEDPSNGIAADAAFATVTVMQHVANGYLKTQYISACKTYGAVMDFAEKGKPFAAQHGQKGKRKIVKIDTNILDQMVPGCKYIDLTDPTFLDLYIPNELYEYYQFPRNCAKKFQEVLIQPGINMNPKTGQWIPNVIPAECMTEIGCV